MIQIDIEMPNNCFECKFSHYEYPDINNWEAGYVCPFIIGKISERFLHIERHCDCPLKESEEEE